MRLFTLVLSLAAALVLVVSANAARKPPPTATTEFTGAPVFVSTPSADGIHRDLTLTVSFTHKGTVGFRFALTFNGVTNSDSGLWRTYRGSGSDTVTVSLPETDCLAPEPGDTISYHLELISPKGAVLAEFTTGTYLIT